MKEIKDYLHLYLGCDVQWQKQIKKLVSVETEACYLFGKSAGRSIANIKSVKPLLRPLSDMNNEEAEHFAWLCMNSKHHLEEDTRISKDEIQIELAHNDGGLQLDNDVEVYIGVSCRCFEGYIVIMKDGRIGAVEEDEPTTEMEPADDIAEKVRYLLSKHFDLFGLIESGLAIDKTAIEEVKINYVASGRNSD